MICMMMQMDARFHGGDVPRAFCWTRFGSEAGEAFASILERKERERRANGGVFYWGIGNSVGLSVADLVRLTDQPEVLFSPIRGRARPKDVAPAVTLRWTAAHGIDGSAYLLPSQVVVHSGRDDVGSQRPHYALVCHSPNPLTMEEHGHLPFGALRNLRTGSRVGASQVTAVVTLVDEGDAVGPDYRIALRARLVAPYFVVLREPVVIHTTAPGKTAKNTHRFVA